MGFQTEYEYERLPTTADEAERAPSECKRKRCRGRIFVRLAGLALVLFGVHHYFGHPSLFSSSSFGHTGCQRLAGPRAEFQAFKEITKDIVWFDDKDYDRGTPVKCYGPSDDGGNFDVPTIKLDGDDVYFFDVPKRKHDLNNPRWQTGGTFTLKVSDKVHKVTVDATITPGEIAFAQVCEFVRESGARGVGVVVPDSAPTDTFENKIDFTVKVPPGATLAIDKLETVFYNYTQDIHDISENAAFNSVNLVNILGYIHSKGITVDGAANITSVNGNVTGSYSATDALGIVAVHGFVGVDIDLIASSSAPANLTISGVGLGVEAYVSLCAAEGDFDPSFNVAASAVASALNVEFVDAPVGSKLTAAASAVTGRANVTLHPTFEGTFEASTVGLTKEIVLRSREGEKDPTGEGRKRTLESHTVGVPFGRGLAGRVYWGDELPENAGSVKLSSLLGSAALTF